MAEHFYGRDFSVRCSNGSAEEMLNAWLVLGRRLPPSDDGDAVLAFFAERKQRGQGWKSFSLNPPPDAIATPGRLAFFAQLIAAFAEELANESPDATLTRIGWDRDLQLMWIAKMLDLLEILRGYLAPPDAENVRPRLTLSESDQIRCDLYRLRHREVEMERRGGDIQTRIRLIDETIRLLSQLPASDDRDRQLCTAHFLRACRILDDTSDMAAYVAGLETALSFERDPEERKELASLIRDCYEEGYPPIEA